MAGLLAWAADVVRAGGQHNGDDDDPDSIPLIFSPEQLVYAQELDRKAASLNRAIQDLRLRLPPPDLSQRLPHLHAHSLASNAALALQLNAHSATKEQVHSREIRLQEENVEYEKALSSCEIKARERLEDAQMLQNKLKELDVAEKNLELELESMQAAPVPNQSELSASLSIDVKAIDEAHEAAEDDKCAIMNKLETKKKELASIEEIVQNLEKKWSKVQDDAMKKPTPAQREKTLDKQLHSLVEQLEAKQVQAERLIHEIHVKETELERLNCLSKSLESSATDVNIARNRYRRTGSSKGHASSEFIVDSQNKVGRTESLQRLMLLRSAFVVYILALHILVFIKISF